MSLPLRKICALAAVMAVWVVSTTCTAAGCLLPVGGSGDAKQAVMPCCSHHAPAESSRDGSDHSGRKCCPSCELTIGTQNAAQHQPAMVLLPAGFALSPSIFALPGLSDFCNGARGDGGWRLVPPDTLLSLHCALLN